MGVVKKTSHYSLFTDGGARGNPGPAAIGGILKDQEGVVVYEFSEYIGETTNNKAEYQALLRGLTEAAKRNIGSLACFLDSELVVEQMNFRYKVKDPELARLFVSVNNLRNGFSSITFSHVPRELNKLADAQVNKALDSKKR